MSPSSPNTIPLIRGSYRLFSVGFEVLTAMLDFFDMKIEATFSFETSVDFQRSTRRYIPEDRTLYSELRLFGLQFRVVQ
jgi:hypothetical protein